MKSKKSKKIIVSLCAMVLLAALIIPIALKASAEMVDVYTDSNPTLDFINIWGGEQGYAASNDSKMISQENGIYKLQSNAYSIWFNSDGISYAYKKEKFNTGKDSLMTIKTTVNKWSGKEIGIVVRESLAADSMLAMCSVRSNGAFYIWRSETAAECQYKQSEMPFKFGVDPIHLKMVLDKSKSRVISLFKVGGNIDSDEGWTGCGSATFKALTNLSQLYVGVGLATADEKLLGVAEFQNFSVNLKAPEGYVEDPSGSDDPSKPSEPEVVIPGDGETVGDALLYETFTDTNLFPSNSEISVSNPFWTVRAGEPMLAVDEKSTNRYLTVSPADDHLMMTAGDMLWCDYSTQMDITFSADALQDEPNTIEMFVRHRSVVIGGSADYFVRITNKISNNAIVGQYLQFHFRSLKNTFLPNSSTLLSEVQIGTGKSMVELGTVHRLKVDAVDNVFKVYFDNMNSPIITYTDDNSKHKEYDPNLMGCIGIGADRASVKIDNILVRKIEDPLGGSYDNEIMGNYNEPIPDWLAERYKKN